MRKDVKFALAVGGILLAVVIAYAIVAGSSDNANHPQAVKLVDDPNAPAPDAPAAEQRPPAAQPQADLPKPAQPDALAPAPDANTDVFANASGSTRPADDVWNQAFRTGRVPPKMISQTPGSDVYPVAADVRAESPDAPARAVPPVTHDPAVGTTQPSEPAPAAVPTTQPINGERQHIVQQDETFSSIAAKTYGSPNYWPHIARRNPSIDPAKLKVGMALILPDPEKVKAPINPVASAGVTHPIDPASEYKVQENDNLHRISIKLYGKADHVEKLYEWNKQLIGNDPRKLKVGMVLKLQDPPAATASTR